MRIFVMILMFVFVLYVTNLISESRLREKGAAYYFSVAIITLVYLACCMYALISMGC